MDEILSKSRPFPGWAESSARAWQMEVEGGLGRPPVTPLRTPTMKMATGEFFFLFFCNLSLSLCSWGILSWGILSLCLCVSLLIVTEASSDSSSDSNNRIMKMATVSILSLFVLLRTEKLNLPTFSQVRGCYWWKEELEKVQLLLLLLRQYEVNSGIQCDVVEKYFFWYIVFYRSSHK